MRTEEAICILLDRAGDQDLREAMLAVMSEYKPVQEEPEAPKQPEPEQPEPEKPKQTEQTKKTGRRPSVDTGKVEALYKAGWTIPKIADEMRVSKQTIKNHLNRLGYK